MSIAIYDDELQQSVEPGTPTATARLATVSAVREAGLNCSVFLMPILPFLTDSREHLDDALSRIRASGATSVLYSSLYLKPGTREWFFAWLEREHPELVGRYRDLYSIDAYAPKEYRRWLADRISPLIRRYGLERGHEDPVTGGPRSRSLGVGSPPVGAPYPAAPIRVGPLTAEELPASQAAALQPTLF
jgi:DNA repair photolyase